MGRGSENYGGFFNNSQFTQQNQFGQQPQPGNQGGLFGQQPQQQAFHGGLPQQQFQAQNQQPQLGYNFGGQPQQQFQQQLQNQQPQQYQFQPQLQPLGGPPPGNQGGPQFGPPPGNQGGPQFGPSPGNQGGPQFGPPPGNQGGPQFGPPPGNQGGLFGQQPQQNQFPQQKNSLTLSEEDKALISETDKLIRKLPVLLEQSVFQNKSIDLANLGKKIAELSEYKEKKLWSTSQGKAHFESNYNQDIDFEEFAKQYASNRLKGYNADFSSLKNTIVAKLYIEKKIKRQVTSFNAEDSALEQYEDCANQLDNTIKWHDNYIANIIEEVQAVQTGSPGFDELPGDSTDQTKFNELMKENFKFKEPLIYVQDCELFALKCTDFQQILEDRKYPEFPIAFIALTYQLASRAFIFNSNNIKLAQYFKTITENFNIYAMSNGRKLFSKISDEPAIIAYAEEHMAIIRKGQFAIGSVNYTYKGKSIIITGEDLCNYYNYSDTHNPTVKDSETHKPTVKDFIIKLGIFSDKMNNTKKQVTITSKEDAYNKYKYLEEILTDGDKKTIESWKNERQDLTKTDRNNGYGTKSGAITKIFNEATTKFGENINGKNLAKKGFGRKFFKTVKEYVKIDKLVDNLITEIYDTTDFKGEIFNDVKKFLIWKKSLIKKSLLKT